MGHSPCWVSTQNKDCLKFKTCLKILHNFLLSQYMYEFQCDIIHVQQWALLLHNLWTVQTLYTHKRRVLHQLAQLLHRKEVLGSIPAQNGCHYFEISQTGCTVIWQEKVLIETDWLHSCSRGKDVNKEEDRTDGWNPPPPEVT